MTGADWIVPGLFGFGLSFSISMLVLHRRRPGHNGKVLLLCLVAFLCAFGLGQIGYTAWLLWQARQ